MNEEKKKEFYEKFVEKVRDNDENDGDYLTDYPEEVLQWIEQYTIEQRQEAKKEFLEKIIQDMFDANALSIPMDYIYHLKKKLNTPLKAKSSN